MTEQVINLFLISDGEAEDEVIWTVAAASELRHHFNGQEWWTLLSGKGCLEGVQNRLDLQLGNLVVTRPSSVLGNVRFCGKGQFQMMQITETLRMQKQRDNKWLTDATNHVNLEQFLLNSRNINQLLPYFPAC